MNQDLEDLFEELIDQQKKVLYSFARTLIPNITEDDLLQPNDFPKLEENPHFRYEEGVLHGLQVARAALGRLFHEKLVP